MQLATGQSTVALKIWSSLAIAAGNDCMISLQAIKIKQHDQIYTWLWPTSGVDSFMMSFQGVVHFSWDLSCNFGRNWLKTCRMGLLIQLFKALEANLSLFVEFSITLHLVCVWIITLWIIAFQDLRIHKPQKLWYWEYPLRATLVISNGFRPKFEGLNPCVYLP